MYLTVFVTGFSSIKILKLYFVSVSFFASVNYSRVLIDPRQVINCFVFL